MPRKRRRLRTTLMIYAGWVIGLVLVVGVLLLLGGAKTAIELALPAAMNGYVTLDEASYFYFGAFDARNMSLVLDWEGKQETVVSVAKVAARPRILPLIRGRLEFGKTSVEGVDLNLRILPSGLANIDRLFRLEPAPPKPLIDVYPPRYSEVRNLRLSFPPYTYKPVQIDSAGIAFYPVSHERLQVAAFGQVAGPLIGRGAVGLYLDMDDSEYVVVYEGASMEFGLETMRQLPVSPGIELQRVLLPEGRLRLSALIAGRGETVERLKLSVELEELNVHSLQYPLSVTNATGRLSTDGRTARIDDFVCLVPIGGANAVLRASGQIYQDRSLVVDAALTNVQLTDNTLAFLPGVSEIKDLLSINGESSLTAHMYSKPAWSVPRIWADFIFRGQIAALDYPVPVYDVRSRVRSAPSGAVIIDELAIELGAGQARSGLSASGTYDPGPEAAQVLFWSPGIIINSDLLERLPQIPPPVSKGLRIDGRVPVEGEYVHVSGEDFLEVRASLVDFVVSMADHPDVAAKGLNAEVQFAGDRLSVSDLTADVLSGMLRLDLDMNFAVDNRSFNGDMVLTDVDLGLLPEEYREEVRGLLNADFHFEGAHPTVPALTMQANLSIREGRIARLPLLVSIINFLNLQLPGEVVFHSARATFRIQEEAAQIDRIELYGDKLNVYARGTVGFDGSIALRAGVGYRKPFLGGVPILGPILTFFTGTLRSALTTVDVAGTVSDPKIRLVSVQYLTSPITMVVRFFAEEKE